MSDQAEAKALAGLPARFRMLLGGLLFAMAPRAAPAPNREDDAAPPPNAPHPADSIEELQARMVEVNGQGEAIRATADAEHRMLTEDETKRLDELDKEFERVDAEVKRRERLNAQRDRLVRPQPRVTRPADLAPVDAPQDGRRPALSITGGEPSGATRGSHGFRSMGEFAKAIVNASRGNIDARIVAAASTYGNETANADGGYAVPPDFRQEIVKTLEGEDSLLSLTDQQFTTSNKLTVPRDSTTPWQSSGGILVAWESEGNQSTPTKPALGQIEVKANKVKALVPVTDELLEDAPALSRYLPGKVADKFTSKINEGIISGDGNGKPEGLLEADSLITVDPEDAQTLPVIYENVSNMWSRMYAKIRGGAVWLINQDLEPFLQRMVVPGTSPSWPAYMPPGGLSDAPYGKLFGRPVIPMEFCETAGTKGSIILWAPKSYLTVQKVGGLRQDVSMHLWFDQDLQAFRFILRMGGQSWWAGPAQRAKGDNTISNIVTLDDIGG